MQTPEYIRDAAFIQIVFTDFKILTHINNVYKNAPIPMIRATVTVLL